MLLFLAFFTSHPLKGALFYFADFNARARASTTKASAWATRLIGLGLNAPPIASDIYSMKTVMGFYKLLKWTFIKGVLSAISKGAKIIKL